MIHVISHKRGYMWVLLIGILLTTAAGEIFAQRRTHNMGDYLYMMDIQDMLNLSSQPEFSPTGTWPQDYYKHATVVFYWTGQAVGKYVDTLGVEHRSYVNVWPSNSGYRQPPDYGMKEYRRVEPPHVFVVVDGELRPSSRRYDGLIDPDLPSDQMIELKYKTPPGLEVTKRTYSFANHNYNDFVIYHNQYVCTFDWDEDPEPDTDINQIMEDVYIFIGYAFQTEEGTNFMQTRWYSESKGDWSTFQVVPSQTVPGGRPLFVSYGWNGNHPDITEFEPGGKAFDNTGNPRFAYGIGGTTPMPSGEFVSSAYGGWAALHVDTSPDNKGDNVLQPHTVKSNSRIDHVWLRRLPGFAGFWEWASSGSKERAEDGAGWPNDPSAHQGKLTWQAFGPYNLAYGDTINIVYAVGAGGISRQLAEEKGREWLQWYRGEAGATYDDAAKNALIATGRDSLFQTLDRANFAWSRKLDIPKPLPSPDLTVTPFPTRILLEWDDLKKRHPHVSKYRVYRKRGTFFNDTHEELRADGTRRRWEMIAEVAGNLTSYEDSDVVRGEPYYYGVTVVDDGSTNNDPLFPGQLLESSKYTNRTTIPAITFEPGEPTAANVRVVPNPYISRAGDFNFAEDNQLLFVNLPPYCTIRIYTVTGDLIKTINHQTGRADRIWDQVTDYNQLVASGVYILHIGDAKNIDGDPIPGTIEKFVIIR